MTDYSEFPTSAQEIIEDLQEVIDEQAAEMSMLESYAKSYIQRLSMDEYRNLVQKHFVDYVAEIPLACSKDELAERMNEHVPGMVRDGWVNSDLPERTAMKIAYKVGAFDKAM